MSQPRGRRTPSRRVNQRVRCSDEPWVQDSWARRRRAGRRRPPRRRRCPPRRRRARAAVLLGEVGPDAGVAVGLELEPDRAARSPGPGSAAGAWRTSSFVPTHVLHVVPELVGEDVDLGEVAGSAELRSRAAGRTTGRCRPSRRPGSRRARCRRWRCRSPGRHARGEQDELGVPVLRDPSAHGISSAQNALDVVEGAGHLVDERLLGRVDLLRTRCRTLPNPPPPPPPQEHDGDDDDDADDPARRHPWRAARDRQSAQPRRPRPRRSSRLRLRPRGSELDHRRLPPV